MKSFLERQDRWGNGYSLWLVVGIVFLIPFMSWSARQLRLGNDVAGLLPEGDSQSRVLNWHQTLFPVDDRVLVTWDDCSLTDPRLQDLSTRLQGIEKNGVREGGSLYVRDVEQPGDLLKQMVAEGIPFDTALQRVRGVLVGDGPLCLTLSDSARSHTMTVGHAIRKMAMEKFGLTIELVQRTLPMPANPHVTVEDKDTGNLRTALEKHVKDLKEPDLQLLWPEMYTDRAQTAEFCAALAELTVKAVDQEKCVTGTFCRPGSMAALSVSFSDAGVEDHSGALAAIRASAVSVGIPAEQLHLGGCSVAGAAMDAAITDAGWNQAAPAWDLLHRSPILFSLIATGAMTCIMLRSFRLCILVQTVSTLCTLAAVSLVTPTGGNMNMLMIVMPALLMVISVSGAIHVCNYWKHSGIDDPVKSVVHAASVAWLPCLLAAATTAAGLVSLTVSSLTPLSDFGLYAAIGCVISFLGVLYLLPAMMLFWPASPPRPEHIMHGSWNRLGQFLSGHAGANCLVSLAITGVCAYGFCWFRTETKVIRNFPEESKLVQDYNFLEQNLTGVATLDTMVRFSQAQQERVPFLDRARTVMKVQEALNQHSEVSGSLSLASFLKLDLADAESTDVEHTRTGEIGEHGLRDRILARLRDGAGDSGIRAASLIAFPVKSADWKRPGDQLLNAAGDEVWQITCQTGIISNYDYSQLTAELASIAETRLREFPEGRPAQFVTGSTSMFLKSQQELLESLISRFGMAFVLIGLVMALLLRSVAAGVYAILPNIMPVAVMFGLLGWGNIHVNIGTMITGSVALWISVDGTLHMVTWFRQSLRKGVPKQDAVVQTLEHCGPALWQTSAAIGLGMLTLYPVELLLISRFGWILCGMIFAALWGNVILLPSLLAGPLGTILERMEQDLKTGGPAHPPGGTPIIQMPEPASVSLPQDVPIADIRAAFVAPRIPHFPRIGSVFPRTAADS